ncbi:Phage capsid scaffolding protein (GPO) serine peptidase [compost metagenome]
MANEVTAQGTDLNAKLTAQASTITELTAKLDTTVTELADLKVTLEQQEGFTQPRHPATGGGTATETDC